MKLLAILALIYILFCIINGAIGDNKNALRYHTTTKRGNRSRAFRVSKTSKRWK